MSPAELDRLEALVKKASPDWDDGPPAGRSHDLDAPWSYYLDEVDAAYIAACDPDTILRLIAAARSGLDVERLRQAIYAVVLEIVREYAALSQPSA